MKKQILYSILAALTFYSCSYFIKPIVKAPSFEQVLQNNETSKLEQISSEDSLKAIPDSLYFP